MASFLSDVGHEVPTSLLPSFLTSTLRAPASALGLIEGISDALAGVARSAVAPWPMTLAASPGGRRRLCVDRGALLGDRRGGTPWQTGDSARGPGPRGAFGCRPATRSGRHRAHARSTAAPTGSSGRWTTWSDRRAAARDRLIAVTGIRTAIFISVIPACSLRVAIIDAIRHTAKPTVAAAPPIRITDPAAAARPAGRLMIGITAFEIGNCATTLLILRATGLLARSRQDRRHATRPVPVRRLQHRGHADQHPGRTARRPSQSRARAGAGAVFFAAGYLWFAVSTHQPVLLLPAFVLAGLGIGCGETAETRRCRQPRTGPVRGSAFGLLATVQSAGNLIASSVAGILWTTVSPTGAFLFLAAAMLVASP